MAKKEKWHKALNSAGYEMPLLNNFDHTHHYNAHLIWNEEFDWKYRDSVALALSPILDNLTLIFASDASVSLVYSWEHKAIRLACSYLPSLKLSYLVFIFFPTKVSKPGFILNYTYFVIHYDKFFLKILFLRTPFCTEIMLIIINVIIAVVLIIKLVWKFFKVVRCRDDLNFIKLHQQSRDEFRKNPLPCILEKFLSWI